MRNSVYNFFFVGRYRSYDNILERLRCTVGAQFTRLLPDDNIVCDSPIFASKFAQHRNYQNFVALANEDGNLAIQDTDNETQRYGVRAHNNAIFDLEWMFNDMQIVTASGDHTARLFDVSGSDIREIRSFYGHSRSVKTIAFRRADSSVFATGGRDGDINIWDCRSNVNTLVARADQTISNSHSTKSLFNKNPKKCRKCWSFSMLANAKSVTGLVFQDENTLISCGAGDGVIKVWDLRKNYLVYKREAYPKTSIPYPGNTSKNGFSSLVLDSDCLRLYANCLDNAIYCYNVGTCNPVSTMKYTGLQNSTFYIKSSLSRDGAYLISGSSDENAFIWNTKHSTPLVKLTGHTAEVTCVAWSGSDNTTIVTCSDDMTHKIWRIGTEQIPKSWKIIGAGKAEKFAYQIDTSCNIRTPQSTKLTCHSCNIPSRGSACSSLKRKRSEDNEQNFNSPQRNHTPRRLFQDLSRNDTSEKPTTSIESLTKDFPNYVIDGIAPHLNFSPEKRKDQDWLTKLRVERQLRKDMLCNESPSMSSKVPVKLETTQKKCSSPQNHILKYFKVKCDGHSCSSKTSSKHVVSNPQSSQ